MTKLASAIATIALIGTPAMAAPPAPVYTWTGFYAGFNVGGSWGNQDSTIDFPGPGVTSARVAIPGGGAATVLVHNAPVAFQESTNPTGLIGGLQFGYNWQSASQWVFGVEADIQGSSESAGGNAHQNSAQLARLGIAGPGGPVAVTINTSQSITQNDGLRWFGTVRGRLGYAIWPTVMVYGTGGLAYGRVNESVAASYDLSATCAAACIGTATLANGTVVPLPLTGNQTFAPGTRTGWTLGAGIAGIVPNTRVTWKFEYLVVDLGTANYTLTGPALGTIAVNTRFIDNIVRVGLNYQFR